MIVPRLHYRPEGLPISAILDNIQQVEKGDKLLVYFNAKYYANSNEAAFEVKKLCLNKEFTLLIQNDIPLAAKTNAEGIFIDESSINYLSARDILGDDKWIGVHASSIEEVADLNDEGLVDFINLGDYKSSFESVSGLIGHEQTRRILDDAKLMGYNIPIIVGGGISAENAQNAMSLRPYGLAFSNIEEFDFLKAVVNKFPLKD